MQTSDNKRATQSNHRKVQASTTLNRKYTKRPAKATDVMVQRSPKAAKKQQPVESRAVQTEQQKPAQKVERSPKITRFGSPTMKAQPAVAQQRVQSEGPMQAATPHPIQTTANARMQAMQNPAPAVSKVTAKQLKDQAIEKALASAEKLPTEPEANAANTKKVKTKKVKNSGMHFGFGRVMLATACAAAAVFAIVYFVNLNMPDISLRVAAMQTGMDPTYPNYVPRDYNVSSITSEDGKITIDFRNGSTGDSFTLTEEKSSWDTNALLSNFVKEEYGENYTIVREQGLTIYVSGSDAAWVNGGIVYKIDTTAGSLTNKQIRSIATSL